ncbi:hypothetical protein KQI48_03545 [Cellulomonas hominis]|uniref:DUF6412 domain-containing protein n=1 Tax=Cellulomonas hominis TaxID=156981 RepID=UPI001C104976|nr:DUF6412 domain-containing protein [Cellulomonas hominis]MBU5421734.1 hypothetical protein [Cellulomonas hominis]
MGDVLPVLALLRDAVVSVALLVGASTPTSALVLVGATTLAVAVAAALLARGVRTLVLDVAALPGRHVRAAADAGPFVAQSDPDAPGRPRPRAPGLALG